MKAIFVKTLKGLEPCDDEGRGMLSKWKLGDEITVEAKKQRFPKHHRLLFALAKIVVDNSERFRDVRHFIDAAKYYAGHYDAHKMKDGNTMCVLKSISFASMSQDEFEPFFKSTVELASKVIGVDAPTLMDEVNEMVR